MVTMVDKIDGFSTVPASPSFSDSRHLLSSLSTQASLPIAASSLMSASPLRNGQSSVSPYFVQTQTMAPQQAPQVVGSPALTPGPQRSRPPLVPVQVQHISHSPTPVVAMPASVLSHIDTVMSEMERELFQIRAYEKQQEACDLRQSHLNEIRKLVADKFLSSEDDELQLMKAEVQRLSTLETDHLAVKNQIKELETQRNCFQSELEQHRNGSERDREELMRVRAECERRMSELMLAAEAIESEKLRAQMAAETANEHASQAANEARQLQAQLVQIEAMAERERLRGAEAIDSQASAEAELKALEGNSRAVLVDCRNLQARVQELEGERVILQARIEDLETQHATFGSMHDTDRGAILDLEKEIEEHHKQHEEHHRNIKVHITRIQELESDNAVHAETITRNGMQLKELQNVLGERCTEIDNHARQHEFHLKTIAELERHMREAEQSDRAHHQQHAIHRTRISEFEQELEVHARQATIIQTKMVASEQVIAEHEAANSAHNRQHASNRSRIQELQNDLLNVQAERDSYAKQCLAHRAKIGEHEQHLEEWRLTEERHNKLHAGNKSKIAELESLWSNAQVADGSHAKQTAVHRARIAELEQQLGELQSAHDSHSRQNQTYRLRIVDFERESEEARANDAKHHRMHGTNRTRIAELEEKLAALEADNDGRARSQATDRARIGTLLQEIEVLQTNKGELDRLLASSRMKVQQLEEALSTGMGLQRDQAVRIQQLENALLDAQATHDTKIKEVHARHDSSIKELYATLEDSRGNLEEVRASEARYRAQHELFSTRVEDSRTKEMQLLAELEESRTAAMDLQRTVADTVQKYEILLKSQAIEFEEKLQQALARQALEQEKKPTSRKTVRMESEALSIKDGRSSVAQAAKARQSLWGELLPSREYLVGVLLPNSSNQFVKKVQAATSSVGDAFQIANKAHVRCIDSQIKSAYDASNSGRDVNDALMHYADRVEIESERRAAADEVEAATHELKALREELACQHDLSMYEQKEVAARIELDLSKCDEEIILLRSASALGEIPATVLNMFLRLQDGGPTTVWEDGFSPLHWAARNGRRDIIEYLLTLQGGLSLLSSRDKHGRAPIYYAQNSLRPGLIHWLQEQAIGESVAPIQVQQGRPGIDGIPEPYLKVLSQVEKHGWHAMNWREGYTMLHWAASKGHIDVCKYLIQLDADVHSKDASGRSPIDIANEQQNAELASLLQSTFTARRSIFLKH